MVRTIKNISPFYKASEKWRAFSKTEKALLET
jgi:hypothetical protein